jgi:uncharacterized iron-regulated protein
MRGPPPSLLGCGVARGDARHVVLVGEAHERRHAASLAAQLELAEQLGGAAEEAVVAGAAWERGE